MTSKLTITDERIEKIAVWLATESHSLNLEMLTCLRELQERRKADGEPVAWTDEEELRDVDRGGCGYLFTVNPVTPHADERRIILLYRHAQPAKSLELAGWQFKSVNGDWLGLIDEHGKNQAVLDGYEVREVFAIADGVNDRDNVRREHAEWSQATFGNVGPVGPLKHLSKEALEAAADPSDLSEWADMQFLLWDAQRRAGITDEQITQAMIEKLAVNKLREWPEPKDGEPRLHIKEQPAPAFLDFDNVLESLDYEVRCNAWESEHVLKACQATYDACRAAMLQELQKSAGAEATCRSNENVQDLQVDNSPVIPDGSASMLRRWLAFGRGMQNAGSQLPHNLIAETEAMLAAAPTGIPMIPDGYVMVPKVATEKMLIAGLEEANPLGGLIDWDASRGDCNTREQVQEIFKAMLAAAPQEVKGE